jgi:hypothetical protein
MLGKNKAKKAAYKEGAVRRSGLGRDHESYTVSKSVKVVLPKGKDFLTHNPKDAKGLLQGASDARVQNAKTSAPTSKKTSRANARGLKAANTPKRMGSK